MLLLIPTIHELNIYTKHQKTYDQTLPQRVHDKNVNGFVRNYPKGKLLVIIVSSSVQTNIVYKILRRLMPFITLQSNRNISFKNPKKTL